MNNEQVAHLLANKSRPQASGSHFYFEGDTIYSYGSHFPVGEFHLDAVNEQGVVAGCHCITWDEIERFAKMQNWI